MYYYLLPQKTWSWLIFPNQSIALGGAIAPRRDCEQRWTEPPFSGLLNYSGHYWRKWSKSHRRLPQGNPCRRNCYSPTFLQYWIGNNQLCMLRIKKIFTSLKNGYDFWILWTKIPWKTILKIEFGAVHQTGKIRVTFHALMARPFMLTWRDLSCWHGETFHAHMAWSFHAHMAWPFHAHMAWPFHAHMAWPFHAHMARPFMLTWRALSCSHGVALSFSHGVALSCSHGVPFHAHMAWPFHAHIACPFMLTWMAGSESHQVKTFGMNFIKVSI